MRRLFTAGTDDTVHCKRPSFQPFPSGKDREKLSPGLCRLPGDDGGGEPRGVAAGRVPAPRRGGRAPGGVRAPAGGTAPLGPSWAAGLR